GELLLQAALKEALGLTDGTVPAGIGHRAPLDRRPELVPRDVTQGALPGETRDVLVRLESGEELLEKDLVHASVESVLGWLGPKSDPLQRWNEHLATHLLGFLDAAVCPPAEERSTIRLAEEPPHRAGQDQGAFMKSLGLALPARQGPEHH